MEQPDPTRRRLVLKVALGGAVLFGAVETAAVAGWLHIADDGGGDGPGGAGGSGGALELSANASPGVGALEVALDDTLLPQVAPRRWRSSRLPTSLHTMVGFTWRDRSADPHLEISSRRGSRWGAWKRVPILHDLPDPGTAEETDVLGTELVWVGGADGVRIRVAGSRPDDLTLVLLHPEPRPSDDAVSGRVAAGRAVAGGVPEGTRRATAVPRPAILKRRDWGADESWRDGTPSYNETIQQAHIHHTASSNDYAPEDVPALIRGMYRYHTKNLGWSDIAYNFLVDRYGRAWEGRAGGVGRPVRGAHTLGFNATSTGFAVIGNFDLTTPAPETISALVGLAAWKLDKYGRRPNGRTEVVSEGSDRYRRNAVVKLPVIDGHRDTNDTACPGQTLYDALPAIRLQTKALVRQSRGASGGTIAITTPYAVAGAAQVGQTLSVGGGATNPADATAAVTWLRDGAGIASGPSYVVTGADLGHQLSVRVDVTKSGYTAASQSIAAGGVVTTTSALVVRAKGGSNRANIRVRAKATGAPGAAAGQVTVTVDGRTKRLDLANDRAVARFVGLPAGSYDVQVAYGGNTLVAGATASTTLAVG